MVNSGNVHVHTNNIIHTCIQTHTPMHACTPRHRQRHIHTCTYTDTHKPDVQSSLNMTSALNISTNAVKGDNSTNYIKAIINANHH